MATIPYQKITFPGTGEYNRIRAVEWPNMVAGDKGQPISRANFADRSACGLGTFAGSTLTWKAFIGDPENAAEIADDANWLKLTDPSDNFLEMTEPKIESVTQIAVLIRPEVSGGATAGITARLIVKE